MFGTGTVAIGVHVLYLLNMQFLCKNLVTAKLKGDYFYNRQCAANCSVRIPSSIFVGCNTKGDRDVDEDGDGDGDDEGDRDIKGCLVE
jgi:hypothetical protein